MLTESLAAFAQTATGSATRIERIELLDAPPALDAGEITDKGSLNSRAIFTNRAAAVERAHAERIVGASTIALDAKTATADS